MAASATELIAQWNRGDRAALDGLMAVLEEQLRRLARAHFRRERPGHTLQPTVIVNEAYMRLVGHDRLQLNDRSHFLAMASRVMRQVLIDHARRRRAERRGGANQVHTAIRDLVDSSTAMVDVLAVDQALERLAILDARQAQVVELKCFGGLENTEVAEALGISVGTVKREWATARMWLSRELGARRT